MGWASTFEDIALRRAESVEITARVSAPAPLEEGARLANLQHQLADRINSATVAIAGVGPAAWKELRKKLEKLRQERKDFESETLGKTTSQTLNRSGLLEWRLSSFKDEGKSIIQKLDQPMNHLKNALDNLSLWKQSHPTHVTDQLSDSERDATFLLQQFAQMDEELESFFDECERERDSLYSAVQNQIFQRPDFSPPDKDA